jgi:hypothetical protein
LEFLRCGSNNPGEESVKTIVPQPEIVTEEKPEIIISLPGKVLDSETNEPVAAKNIFCCERLQRKI